jgi:TolA-binding protein
MRRLLPLLLILLALGGASPAAALAATGDPNQAIAVNQTDGASVFEFAFDVQNTLSDTIDQENGALAYSSCEACQTVAVAIQFVLVSTENPGTITPLNEAVAINDQCTSCSTLATALQFVVGTGEPIRLTHRGQAELDQIRRLLGKLKKRFEAGKLTTDDVKLELADIQQRLRRISREEIVPADQRGDGKGLQKVDEHATETEAGSRTTPSAPAPEADPARPAPTAGQSPESNPAAPSNDATAPAQTTTTTPDATGTSTTPAPSTP